MRTKLYVLGAVLGATPGLLPVLSTLWLSPPQESRQESRGGSSRKGRGGSRAQVVAPAGSAAGVASPPDMSDTSPEGGGSEPKHPCELITVMQVPCDATAATCEYTYWQCPEQAKPLRA
jgi:hypothetical protein